MKEKNEDIHLFILKEDRRRNRERVLREKTQAREPSEHAFFSPQDLVIAKEVFKGETVAAGQSDSFGSEDLRSYAGLVEPAEVGVEPSSSEISFGLDTQIRGTMLCAVVCSFFSIIALLWLYFGLSGMQSALEWTTPSNVILQGLLWVVIIVLGLFEIQVLKGMRDARAR